MHSFQWPESVNKQICQGRVATLVEQIRPTCASSSCTETAICSWKSSQSEPARKFKWPLANNRMHFACLASGSLARQHPMAAMAMHTYATCSGVNTSLWKHMQIHATHWPIDPTPNNSSPFRCTRVDCQNSGKPGQLTGQRCRAEFDTQTAPAIEWTPERNVKRVNVKITDISMSHLGPFKGEKET